LLLPSGGLPSSRRRLCYVLRASEIPLGYCCSLCPMTVLLSTEVPAQTVTKGPTKCAQGGGTIACFQEAREASRSTPLRCDIRPGTRFREYIKSQRAFPRLSGCFFPTSHATCRTKEPHPHLWHPQSASRSLEEDFEANLEALVDDLLVLPLVQRNVLKLEMVRQG
jgi:hypothetical protein